MKIYRRLVRLLYWIIAAELAAMVVLVLSVLLFDIPLRQPQAVDGAGPGARNEPQPSRALSTATLHPPEVPTATSTAPPPTPRPEGIWVEADLPADLSAAAQDWQVRQSGRLAPADHREATVTIGWQKRDGASPLAEVVLVPVVPFSSLRGGIQADELRRIWLGQTRAEDVATQWLVTVETADALDGLFGAHAAEAPLAIVPPGDLVERLCSETDAIAIVPYDRLEPRLRPLTVDGLSVLDRDLDLSQYPLRANVWIGGPRAWQRSLSAEVAERDLSTNRHPERLTVLAMTGVTALTRKVAICIEERQDWGWPAHRVADLLAAADLTHVSNEVSFKDGCKARHHTSAFCAKPEYMDTLRLVGADLIELTGNHNMDFGRASALYSLDLYAEAGMRTFGGGRNAKDARRPLLITHNGNRLAFLGYNQFGPKHAWARSDRPGAARFSLKAVQADLARVASEADLVFVSIQHTERYRARPLPAQVSDFHAVMQAGADVVTGSQAHQPQAIEFCDGKPIFYGLGNLFFDQTWSAATSQSLIVRHTIYDGRLLASEVIPTIMDKKLQPRLADEAERESILRTIFAASGW
jgi:poly-gamma-glutamate synthesis protein (capsule biosynthesis protein)